MQEQIKTRNRTLYFTAGKCVPQTYGEKQNKLGRAGAWEEFVRRFDPITVDDGGPDMCTDVMFDLGIECAHSHVWTVVDYEGQLYLSAGWRFVNRLGYVVAKNPRDPNKDYKEFKY